MGHFAVDADFLKPTTAPEACSGESSRAKSKFCRCREATGARTLWGMPSEPMAVLAACEFGAWAEFGGCLAWLGSFF